MIGDIRYNNGKEEKEERGERSDSETSPHHLRHCVTSLSCAKVRHDDGKARKIISRMPFRESLRVTVLFILQILKNNYTSWYSGGYLQPSHFPETE